MTPARAAPGRAGVPFTVRPATEADNAALVELAAACPMRAAISICVHRAPDFFALNRLEGDRFGVSLAETGAGHVIGCVAAAVRRVWLDGAVREITHTSDLKVHPEHRGTGVADALVACNRDWCRGVGAEVPVVITVLRGNERMERRIAASRGLPRMTRVGTVRVHTLPMVGWGGAATRGGGRVARATPGDLDEMAEHWREVMSRRHFAPACTAEELAEWIARAPGLEVQDYWVARNREGRITGYLALWDQRPLKQLCVVGLTRQGAVFRGLYNAVAPVCGALRLPAPGEPVASLAAIHVCVPPDGAEVLHRLLVTARQELRGRYSFITLGLDLRDPLAAALRGLVRLSADVDIHVALPDSPFPGLRQRSWPVHLETALV